MSGERSEQSDATTGGTVLVTGGSGAIGGAIVDRLRRAGRDVAFTYRSGGERATALEERTGAVAWALDLADRGAVEPLIEAVEERQGAITGLVNAAGVQRSQLLAMTGDDAWDEVIDLNLGAAFRCCRAVLRGMVVRRAGAIVSVASLSALHGVGGLAAYAAAKAGVLAMTRCLAREVGRRNIRVNAVVPGYVASEMTADVSDDAVAKLRAGECLPGGTPAEAVAEAVAFLLSGAASAITGQSLVVDAGTSA